MTDFMTDSSEKRCILEGIISVEAAINADSRQIYEVYIDREKVKKRDRKTLSFLSLLRDKNISAHLCERDVIDAFLENAIGNSGDNQSEDKSGSSHGGIVASAGEKRYCDLSVLCKKAVLEKGFLVYLDGVEDPFNFGYSIRNLYAAGASGIIIPQRNWLSASAVCARSSAGASELCDIAISPDLTTPEKQERFIYGLKKQGLTVACAAATKDAVSLLDTPPSFPLILFIGGEKRGITKSFVENADMVYSIPYSNKVRYSLPTASVAAVFGFEFKRYKGKL